MPSTGLTLRNFNWTTGGFIIAYHLALLAGLPFYFANHPPEPGLIAASVVLLFLTQIGIGAAYHRYYAHRSYTMSRPAEVGLLFLGSLATQGSVLEWAHDHRLHHAYVDTDRDPYSIKKGFWYAHILWLFHKQKPIDMKRIPDLASSRLLQFQHRWHGALSMTGNGLVFLLMGWAFGDYLGAFVLAWWTRLMVSHHLTWFVNSLAHTWGARTYSREQSAVDNYVLAVVTVGEGYHNYHHTFASDYRNGPRWYHFDPAKWLIWILSRVGQTRDLIRFDAYRVRRRLLDEDRRLLLDTLRRAGREGRLELERKVVELAERLHAKLTRIAHLTAELKKRRSTGDPVPVPVTMRLRVRALRRSLRRDWKGWSRVCTQVLESC